MDWSLFWVICAQVLIGGVVLGVLSLIFRLFGIWPSVPLKVDPVIYRGGNLDD